MDIIDRSIEIGKHITNNVSFINSTWDSFSNITRNKKLIIYGVTDNIFFIWLRTNMYFLISAAIDNDEKKQGHKLKDFFDESDLKDAENIIIESKSILKLYNPDEVVIFISSLKYSEEIAKDLDNENFHCYFSLLHLEFNYREYMKKNKLPFETLDTYKKNYAKQCLDNYQIIDNKIVLYAQGSYTDHEKYIAKQLLSMNAQCDIVLIISRQINDVPRGIRIVFLANWKKCIYEMLTAKIWIFDVTIPNYIMKRKEQIYIQTKHWGSITLKKFYLDAPSVRNVGSNEDDWKLNGEMMDYIISGSAFDEISCKRGFAFNGKFLRFGSPRSDVLFQHSKKYKEKICNKFNININNRILLYAPTYRFLNGKGENRVFEELNLDFEMLLNSLKIKWNYDWKIFIRLHPGVRIQAKKISKPDYVIDLSDYDDSQELLAISDILISDFSSIMFEPAYVLKPVFLYAPDKDEYEKNDYELLLDYNSLPFPISTTNEELVKQIINFDEAKYKQEVKEFLDKYGVHEDGHASERAAKFILKLLSGEGDIHA